MEQPWLSNKQIATALHRAESDSHVLDGRGLLGVSTTCVSHRDKEQTQAGTRIESLSLTRLTRLRTDVL